MVPERYRSLIEANPLTHLVELYRQALLGPSLVPPPGVGWLALFAAAVLAAGLGLFRRLRPAFVDEI
jgi:lipopolysaccharide transport system permease protein